MTFTGHIVSYPYNRQQLAKHCRIAVRRNRTFTPALCSVCTTRVYTYYCVSSFKISVPFMGVSSNVLNFSNIKDYYYTLVVACFVTLHRRNVLEKRCDHIVWHSVAYTYTHTHAYILECYIHYIYIILFIVCIVFLHAISQSFQNHL